MVLDIFDIYVTAVLLHSMRNVSDSDCFKSLQKTCHIKLASVIYEIEL